MPPRTAEPTPLEPEIAYTPSGRTVNPLEANGIRPTPDGRFLIFDSLNNQELYRLTPPPPGNPDAREIQRIEVDGELGDTDGLEFLGNDLLVADNRGELIRRVAFSSDFLTGRVLSSVGNPESRTPTQTAVAPGDRLLVTNAEFFDQSEPGEPFFAVSIPIESLAPPSTTPPPSPSPPGNDECTIEGTEGDDVICGFAGADEIDGKGVTTS